MRVRIDQFLLYIATERGLSTAYQLSVRQTLDALLHWLENKKVVSWDDMGTDELSMFLTHQKNSGLSAASLRVAVVRNRVGLHISRLGFLCSRQRCRAHHHHLLVPSSCIIFLLWLLRRHMASAFNGRGKRKRCVVGKVAFTDWLFLGFD